MSTSDEIFTTQNIAELLSNSSGTEFEEKILAETKRCLEEEPVEDAKKSIDKLIEVLESFKEQATKKEVNTTEISEEDLALKLQEKYDEGFNAGYTKANYDMIDKIIDDISKVKSATN
ncbi:MAG: hypothetical protein IKR19_08670 [Acholeplasmatales bacterium]|nr:hypothetical protein [Acholeplasmatales bacterium]